MQMLTVHRIPNTFFFARARKQFYFYRPASPFSNLHLNFEIEYFLSEDEVAVGVLIPN